MLLLVAKVATLLLVALQRPAVQLHARNGDGAAGDACREASTIVCASGDGAGACARAARHSRTSVMSRSRVCALEESASCGGRGQLATSSHLSLPPEAHLA